MPAVTTAAIVGPARAARRGVGAFNVIGIEHAEAIVAGAEAAGAAVVLQVSENCVAYHGALEPIGQAMLAVARAAAVPTAVHLDHATSEELVRAAVRLGFGSVMYDASRLPYADNVKATASIAAWCHARGIWLEAELGEVGGKDGVHAPGARTEPGEAAAFVDATGVDALAVAVGSSHAMLTRDAVLDLDLVTRIRAAVPQRVPDAVVHGDPDARLPHIVTFSCLYVDGEALVTELDRAGFSVSSGSACVADTRQPSHVLAAMGALTHGNVRVSLPRTAGDPAVTAFLDALPPIVARIRETVRAATPRTGDASPEATP